MTDVVVTVALEGSADVSIVERLLSESDLRMGKVYVQNGKDSLDRNLGGFNNAARFAHWFVLRDLDQDGECAPELKVRLLPKASSMMCFRFAVRAAESWLLADRERFARFLAIQPARMPADPDALADPKGTVVSLARRSRKPTVRQDMTPRPGTSARVGPGYTSRITEFVTEQWHPRLAARNSPSLASCLAALQRWRRTS